ncbi:MAG: CBS domain-containing protein [Alphaproteobacteria bacterium]|nr:CBS domain-containing protein [Alphaproteobacteria bacterium]
MLQDNDTKGHQHLIKDIMNKDVKIVSPDAKLDEVAKKMEQHDCGSVLVTKDDRLVGIITDRDIAIRCVAASHHPLETTAGDVMSSDILYCRDTDAADAVAKNMGENKVRRLAVLDANKRLVGMVSLGDLASHTNHLLCGEVLGQICKAA